MDLLFKDIQNIPNSEILKAIYVVDGYTKYATTYCDDLYNLYTINSHVIELFVKSFENLNDIDMYVNKEIGNVQKQTSIMEKDLKIVYYNTGAKDFKYVQGKSMEKTVIDRYVSSRQLKLF